MNNKFKILMVEDEEAHRAVLTALLEQAGYQTIPAENCSNARMMFSSYHPDLILLDLGLPDGDGMDVLEAVRRESQVPVIILSARTDERDKVLALDAGANDYVTKPFGAAELLARIRSTLRNSRYTPGKPGTNLFQVRDLVINFDSRQVFAGPEEIKFTQTEYNILSLLAENCGKMMTYAAIIKAIWGYPDEGSTKRLQVNMTNIRRKLATRPGDERYISNEVGVGYRMNSNADIAATVL